MGITEELITELLKEFLHDPINTLERFQQVHKIHPDDNTMLYYWGVALAELGRFDEAIEKLKRFHDIYPNDPRPLYIWGAALAELGRLIDAQEKFERADMLLLLYETLDPYALQ